MSLKDTSFNWQNRSTFKVLQGGSFTVPSAVTVTSPTSGLLASPAGNADTLRPTVGGQLVSGFSDAAGPTHPDQVVCVLNPGDVVAVSAVVSNVATVTVTSVNGIVTFTATISGVTTVAGVVGFYN